MSDAGKSFRGVPKCQKLGWAVVHKQSLYLIKSVYCSACFASIPSAALKTKWHSFEMRWFCSPSADILGDAVSFLAAVIFFPDYFGDNILGSDTMPGKSLQRTIDSDRDILYDSLYNITMKAARPAGLLLTRRQLTQSINRPL